MVTGRALLDTHVVLWAVTRPPAARRRLQAIAALPGRPFISSVSVADIALEVATGKLAIPDSPAAVIPALNGQPLDLTAAHAVT